MTAEMLWLLLTVLAYNAAGALVVSGLSRWWRLDPADENLAAMLWPVYLAGCVAAGAVRAIAVLARRLGREGG